MSDAWMLVGVLVGTVLVMVVDCRQQARLAAREEREQTWQQ
jgi:hypothetical protein